MTTIRVTNNDWQTKKLVIKNKTVPMVRTLSNGKVIPTWEAMLRQAAKV